MFRSFHLLEAVLGTPSTFLLYSACSLAGAAGAGLLLPETHGRSHQQIEMALQ